MTDHENRPAYKVISQAGEDIWLGHVSDGLMLLAFGAKQLEHPESKAIEELLTQASLKWKEIETTYNK